MSVGAGHFSDLWFLHLPGVVKSCYLSTEYSLHGGISLGLKKKYSLLFLFIFLCSLSRPRFVFFCLSLSISISFLYLSRTPFLCLHKQTSLKWKQSLNKQMPWRSNCLAYFTSSLRILINQLVNIPCSFALFLALIFYLNNLIYTYFLYEKDTT